MTDAGESVTADEKSSIDAAIAALKEAMKGNDKATIEARTKELTDASGKMAERMYAKKEADQTTASASQEQANQKQASSAKDDVVDAEFEEVKGKQ
jgi:molecular chaperone DnaK